MRIYEIKNIIKNYVNYKILKVNRIEKLSLIKCQVGILKNNYTKYQQHLNFKYLLNLRKIE